MRTLAAFALAAPLLAAQFRAGYSARPITPPLAKPVYLAGFGNNRTATAVHDPLTARCLALSAQASNPTVLCAVDLIGLFHDDVLKIRAAVPQANLIVAATHTHQGPDTMGLWGPAEGVSGIDEAYMNHVVAQTAEAARQAIAGLQPAQAFPAQITPQDVNSYYDDSRPPDLHDPAILSLALRTPAGRPIATLVNWTNHPETLGDKNTLITSDWVHYLRSHLEANNSGPVVYFNGAIGGMQSPLGAKLPAPPETFQFAEYVGLYAAKAVLASQKSAKPTPIDSVLFRETRATIPVANQNFVLASQAGIFKGRKIFTPAGSEVPVGLLRLSGANKPVLEIALIPGEMYPELSIGPAACQPESEFPNAQPEPPIKSLMHAPFRLLIGLANDEIGYILPQCQWDEKPPFTFGATKRWYGEVNSVGPEAGPRIAAAFAQLLKP